VPLAAGLSLLQGEHIPELDHFPQQHRMETT
jgi:hypothetical protein